MGSYTSQRLTRTYRWDYDCHKRAKDATLSPTLSRSLKLLLIIQSCQFQFLFRWLRWEGFIRHI